MTSFWESEDLLEGLEYAQYLVCNEYEFDLIKEKTGLNEETVFTKVEKIIVTLWEKWAKLISKNENVSIKWFVVKNPVDPTGAGDAFIATVVAKLSEWESRENSIKYGNAVASFVVENKGGMQHEPSLGEIEDR